MANLIDVLIEDHEQVKAMLADISAASGGEQASLFSTLRTELVRHEVAEEEIVRPLTKASVPDGDRVASDRIAEENEAEKILKKMDKEDVGSETWQKLFDELRSGVLIHAEHEQEIEFPELRRHVDETELEEKGRLFEAAKKASTAPVEADRLAPVADLKDRALEAVTQVVEQAKAS